MNLEVVEPASEVRPLRWDDLPDDLQEALTGTLVGLWGARGDEEAFDSLPVDKQQALLLILSRLRAKRLWHLVGKISNLYGEGGVGIEFSSQPMIESTLLDRKDFTRLLANHRDTSAGFYEKGRAEAALHFLRAAEASQKWHVHFDLYSPVHSPGSALRHLRHELIGKVVPDWRMIQQRLKS